MTDAPLPAPLVGDLVLANRILAANGVLDAFGHVSVRDPAHPGCFLLSRSRAPADVEAADIRRFGPDGEQVGGPPVKPYLERFIHSEIYATRPDIAAIVHSHSPSVLPFGVTGTALKPLCHVCGFLGEGAPIFDTRTEFGDTDLLIRNRAMGRALARNLGGASSLLMRGHGSVVVAESVREAVFRAVYLEHNAKLVLASVPLGPVNYLTPGEAMLAAATTSATIDRAWDHWAAALD